MVSTFASSATEIPLRLPKLHESQQRVRNNLARFNVYDCGRRWGKTTFGLDLLLDDPNQKGALDGYPVAWFAPNSKLFDEAWLEAVKLTRPIATQAAFIEQYLVDLNGAAAARRAGYSARMANRIATENLQKPHIKAAIDAALQEPRP